MKKKLTKLEEIINRTLILISKIPPEKRNNLWFGEWDLKDVLAHLSGWCQHQLECFTAMEEKREPSWRESIDDYNNQQVELRRKRDWDEVFSELTSLTNKLLYNYRDLSKTQWEHKFWKNRSFTPKKLLDIELRHWSNGHLPEIERVFRHH